MSLELKKGVEEIFARDKYLFTLKVSQDTFLRREIEWQLRANYFTVNLHFTSNFVRCKILGSISKE